MIDHSSALLKALGVSVLLGVGAFALSGCSRDAEAAVKQPAPIAVESAQAAGTIAIYRGPGTAAATHVYRVGFEIGGRVSEIGADTGDRVAAGSTLAALDATDERAQFDSASARAASARASLQKALTGARPQERAQAAQIVDAAQANVARAQAALDLARANDARMRSLLVQGDVSQQQADTARTALLDAQGALLAAQAQAGQARQGASLIEAGERDEDKQLASAEANAAKANLALAAAALRKTRITAPADAFVQSRSVERGDQVSAGAVAFVLVDAAPSDVLVDLPERLASTVQVGTPVTIRSEGKTYAGRVYRVEPSADDATRTVRLRVRVSGATIRPGAVLDVAIGERALHGASVPANAVLQQGSGTAVLVYDEKAGTVARRAVEIVSAQGERTVVDGVRPGERVVVAGQYAVSPGDAVRIASGS
jgi:multidrug efflux pump subunit AcrA (membrane-fusion protein)